TDPEGEGSRSRRSGRSLRSSPGTTSVASAPEAPRFTASGRQIRKPGTTGESKSNETVIASAGRGYAYVLEDVGVEGDYTGSGEGGDRYASGSEADDEEEDIASHLFDEHGNRKSKVVMLKIGDK